MANISLGDMIAMASFLQQKKRSEKQRQSQSQQPRRRASVPVKGWGGRGSRSRKAVNTAPRQKRLAFISSGGRGRGPSKGTTRKITGQQKINYMRRGLEVQEQSAQRMRTAALDDMLEYQRVRDAQAGSGAISETELKMRDMLGLMVDREKGDPRPLAGEDPNEVFFDFNPEVNTKYQVDLYGGR